eukprot:SAG31_NODE_26_length_32985_cov_39.054096_4_plen_71_part_00
MEVVGFMIHLQWPTKRPNPLPMDGMSIFGRDASEPENKVTELTVSATWEANALLCGGQSAAGSLNLMSNT